MLKPPESDPLSDPAECPFCDGNETKTPPEVEAFRPEGGARDGPGWLTRVVPNLYPALAGESSVLSPQSSESSVLSPQSSERETGMASAADPLRASSRGGGPDMFVSQPATGAHEVIVHTPKHHRHLIELDEAGFDAAIDAWRARLRAHQDASYCHLIVNEGAAAGASLDHSHAQFYALPFVPTDVARERERFTSYRERTNGGDLLGDVASEEVRRNERLVAIDDEALIVCPWASRGPFELRVIPRQSAPSFGEDHTGTAMIRTALRALAERFEGPPPLNLWLRTAPRGVEAFHWHLDLLPRLTVRAGFEIGTGVEISTFPPERAAAELRDCLAE
jgi:UDPglucose--hexose-1-phosphate uridylyltransferase